MTIDKTNIENIPKNTQISNIQKEHSLLYLTAQDISIDLYCDLLDNSENESCIKYWNESYNLFNNVKQL